jgi:transposase
MARMGGGQHELARLQEENHSLHQRAQQLAAERDQAASERDAALEARDLLAARCSELDEQVQHLIRQLFGKKTEKLSNHPMLPFPEPEGSPPAPPAAVLTTPDEESGTIGPARRPRRASRLRSDLPRQRIEITLPEDERRCAGCNQPMQPFGEEVTERLDYKPAEVVVREYAVIKYSCPCCQVGVRAAAVPPAVIEKGMAEPGLLAQIVVAKYGDHLPLERQENIFRRHGIDLPKSTMCDWIRAVADRLTPVVSEMTKRILKSHVIQTDDTAITVLDRAAPGGSRKGYLWVYVVDQDVVYDHTRTRGRTGPLVFLNGYAGYLQADAYAGYDEVFREGTILEVGCWAHSRRRFFDAAKLGSEVAVRVLHLLKALYDVESDATERGLSPEDRCALRQEKSRPLLDVAKPWMEAEAKRALPQSILGKAFAYCLKLWPALTRYLDDGRLAIDNNRAEREMRRVAVGRKNWEFAGSEDGARRAAILYSIIASCQSNQVEPWKYLTDVLGRLSTHPARAIDELTPRGWKAAHTPPEPAVTILQSC